MHGRGADPLRVVVGEVDALDRAETLRAVVAAQHVDARLDGGRRDVATLARDALKRNDAATVHIALIDARMCIELQQQLTHVTSMRTFCVKCMI